MQFTTIFTVAFAAVAFASPTSQQPGQVLVSLPPGCTTSDLTKCVLHLVGTTGSCGAAVIMAGADPVADISCIGSAAGTAASFDECKNCIPKSTQVV